jgi:hypothetical protein
MPVNETLSLGESLSREQLGLDLVILNALYPVRFYNGEVEELGRALARARSPRSRSALRAALSEHARAESQREQRDRLNDGLSAPLAELHYVFADHLGVAEVAVLADELDGQL